MSKFRIGCLTAGIIILLSVGAVFAAVNIGGNGNGSASEPLSSSSISTSFSIPLIDSDNDGFSDWFEENIAGYDPNIPNDRYIILYFRILEDPGSIPYAIEKPTKFFIKKGGVPLENIITLAQEEAYDTNLQNAIEQIAEKSDKNDIVFLKIGTHGTSGGFSGNVKYTLLDEWLDQIEAKVVIVVIMACHSEAALPILKEGGCPRIVYAHTSGEFIGTLGNDLRYSAIADGQYGNGDGYVSIKEVESYLTFHIAPAPKPTWGFIQGTDTSNIADQIYLTDYKIPS